MGLGTARGGCQFCKLDVQMGSIPVRSTYTDIAQSGEHFPYKEGVGSSILSVSTKRERSVKVSTPASGAGRVVRVQRFRSTSM